MPWRPSVVYANPPHIGLDSPEAIARDGMRVTPCAMPTISTRRMHDATTRSSSGLGKTNPPSHNLSSTTTTPPPWGTGALCPLNGSLPPSTAFVVVVKTPQGVPDNALLGRAVHRGGALLTHEMSFGANTGLSNPQSAQHASWSEEAVNGVVDAYLGSSLLLLLARLGLP